jgi:hypothetical protein
LQKRSKKLLVVWAGGGETAADLLAKAAKLQRSPGLAPGDFVLAVNALFLLMAMTGPGDASLSGLWQGRFSYPRGHGPEFFTATLLETPEWLSGSTQETAQFGRDKRKTLYATLLGRREGRAVTFRKTYESETRSHAVDYNGTLSADGLEIEGTWTVPRSWSGKFLMIRSSGLTVAAKRSIKETV